MDSGESLWEVLYTGPDPVKVALLMAMLHDRMIPSTEMNKKDSVYQVFGDIEVMIPVDRLDEAKEVLALFIARNDA